MKHTNPSNQIHIMDLDIDLQIASPAALLPDLEQIQTWVATALDLACYQAPEDLPTELTLRIVETEESQNLNHSYRGKDKSTNVLSFPFDGPENIPLALLGDLVICAPVVKLEAQQQDKTEQAHWAHMIIHGTLHLLGYDHMEEQEAEVMEALEINILGLLGFNDPYAIK